MNPTLQPYSGYNQVLPYTGGNETRAFPFYGLGYGFPGYGFPGYGYPFFPGYGFGFRPWFRPFGFWY